MLRSLTASGFFVGAGRQFGWFWLGGLYGIGHGTAGVLESITLAGDLDDLGVVQEAIEDGGGGWHVTDEFAPVFHGADAGRILIVDDNHDSAESLAMLLKATGNETHTASDGHAAVEEAMTFRPEVVLLDIGLPKLNGYDVARRTREKSWGKGMLLVAVTGWGQEQDRQKSKDAGFDDHLVKPVEYAALEKLLATLPS